MVDGTPLSLDTTTEEPKISLNPDLEVTSPLPPQIADNRAAKAEFGLSDLNKSHADYFQAISQGYENTVRKEVATELDYDQQQKKMAVTAEVAKNATGPIDL